MEQYRSTTADQEHTPSLGEVVDNIVRRINILGIVDFYLGSNVDYASKTIRLYLSSHTPQESIQELKEQISSEDYRISLQHFPENTDGVGWMIFANLSQAPPLGTKAYVSGEVPTRVPIKGTLRPNQKVEPPKEEEEEE